MHAICYLAIAVAYLIALVAYALLAVSAIADPRGGDAHKTTEKVVAATDTQRAGIDTNPHLHQ